MMMLMLLNKFKNMHGFNDSPIKNKIERNKR